MKISPFPVREIPGSFWPASWIRQFEILYRGLTNYTNAIENVTVGTSPFAFQNTRSGDADITVQGGTVSKIELGRGSTYVDVGSTAGMYRLSPDDYLRVTYSVAPTMRAIPR